MLIRSIRLALVVNITTPFVLVSNFRNPLAARPGIPRYPLALDSGLTKRGFLKPDRTGQASKSFGFWPGSLRRFYCAQALFDIYRKIEEYGLLHFRL